MIYSYNALVAKAHILFDIGGILRSTFISSQFHVSLKSFMTEAVIIQKLDQSIDLLCKSMDWFLYDNALRHERVKDLSYYLNLKCILPERILFNLVII